MTRKLGAQIRAYPAICPARITPVPSRSADPVAACETGSTRARAYQYEKALWILQYSQFSFGTGGEDSSLYQAEISH